MTEQEENAVVIRRKDDTDAFDQSFLTIYCELPESWIVSKAEFICRDITKEYYNPTFPLEVSLSAKETAMLEYENECFLILYDTQNRRVTCDQSYVFHAEPEVD